MPRRLGPILRQHRRRLLVGMALFAYCLSVCPLPLPARALKSSDQPFPCQHRACGCESAEQCWHHCCCLSSTEQRQWALDNHVTPPADARCRQEESSGWSTVPLRQQGKKAAASAGPGACAACHKAPQDRAGPRACCRRNAPSPASTPVPAPRRWALISLACTCQGKPGAWMTASITLPPPCVVCLGDALPIGWAQPASPAARSWISPPSAPPPRS